MTPEPRLHSAAFSAADHLLAQRIRGLEDRIVQLEARTAQPAHVRDGACWCGGYHFEQLIYAARASSPQPPAAAA